jgi:tetratricopeptide (TPR) repeat protein/DNA-binding CsgD family transcriptional regulator
MFKKYLYFIFLVCFFQPICAKPVNLDSAVKQLRLTFDEPQRLALCLFLGKNYLHIDYTKAYQYSYEALGLAEKLHISQQIQLAKLQVGEALAFSGRNIEALAYFEQVLQTTYAQKDDPIVIKALAGLARANMMLNFDDKALQYYMEILAHVSQDKDRVSIGVHQWLAHVYKKQKNYEQALSYLKKDLSYDENKNNPSLLSEIGNLYYIQKQYAEAMPYYQDAYEAAKQQQNIQACGFSTNNIGLVYMKQKEYQKAIAYYQLSLNFSREVGNKRDYANTLSNLAQLHTLTQEYNIALNYAQQGFEEVAQLKDYPLLLELANNQIKIYTALNNDKQVIAYQALVISYHDSLNAQHREQEMVAIKMQTKIAQDKQEIQNLITENKMLRIYSYVGIFSFVLFGVISFLFYYNYRLRKKMLQEKEKGLATLAAKESAEAALKAIEEKLIQEKIDQQNRVLVSQALLLTQKNEVLETAEQQIGSFVRTLSPLHQEKANILLKELRNNTSKETDWHLYKKHFEEVHPFFFKTLQTLHPALTNNDLRICAYLKMQLTNKEIANVLGIGTDSLKVTLSRLKNKLEIGKETDLREYIENIELY